MGSEAPHMERLTDITPPQAAPEKIGEIETVAAHILRNLPAGDPYVQALACVLAAVRCGERLSEDDGRAITLRLALLPLLVSARARS